MSETTAAAAPASRTAAPAALPVDPALAVALLFFVSGGASLLLETAAVRAFVDLFGSTAASLGAIGGAFLACLAVGAIVCGPLADRSRRPLRLYALLEAIAGVGGLLALLLLSRIDALATSFARAEAGGSPRPWLRLMVGFAILLVPVGALGGTLPVLARLRRGMVGRAAAAGVLQAANALGGAVGAFLAGAFLLNALGTSGTWRLAALTSLFVAVVAGWLGRSATLATSAPPEATPAARRGDEPLPRAALLIVASACIGFTLLATEILLFRGLVQLVRNGHDTLGVLLAAFLLGGALGSEAGVALARDVRRARDGLLLGLLLSVITPLAALVWLRAAAFADDSSFLHFGVSALTWSGRLVREFFGALLVAGPVAFALALPFPAMCELHPDDDRRFGRAVAWLSGAWTAGAAVAGLIVPAHLLPWLTLRGSLLACAALPLAALLLLELFGRGRMVARRIGWCVAGVALIAGLLGVPVAGGSIVGVPLRFTGRVAGTTGARVLAYGEDALANVSVLVHDDGTKLLAVDDQMALGGSGASKVETMEAVIPTLLYGGSKSGPAASPKRALLLGVGAGITAAGLRDLGVDDIDAVELLPLVCAALPAFAAENGSIQRDPHVHLHVADARAFVRAAEPASYDLIVGDLFFPWQPETGLLYTREHFERVRRLLKPGGIFCQWLPGHQLRWEEIGLVGRTFCDVFPGATIWLARPDFAFPVLALIASTDRIEVDVPALTQRLAEPSRLDLLKRLGVADPMEFLSLYVGDEWFIRDHFDDVGLNSEDRAQVEFSAGRRVESDAVVALFNRGCLYDVHEDVAGRMSRNHLDEKERGRLQRNLDVASKLTWRTFDAQTMMLLAAANRMLPESERRNKPEELEAKAFQELGETLAAKPDHAPTLELMAALLRQELEERNFALVVEGDLVLENDKRIGPIARFSNLCGMAFLMAVCDPDPEQAAQFTKPLDFAIKKFRQAVALDPQLIEAQVQLAISLFLKGGASEREESLALLDRARDQIVAPDRPDGHGLPIEGEAIRAFLRGERAAAIDALRRARKSAWNEKILATMESAPK